MNGLIGPEGVRQMANAGCADHHQIESRIRALPVRIASEQDRCCGDDSPLLARLQRFDRVIAAAALLHLDEYERRRIGGDEINLARLGARPSC